MGGGEESGIVLGKERRVQGEKTGEGERDSAWGEKGGGNVKSGRQNVTALGF